LSRSYVVVKQYAQALVLIQRSKLHAREAQSFLGLDPINESASPFYSLIGEEVEALEIAVSEDETRFKEDWFAFNGGQVTSQKDTSRKPLFFDIALNYVQLDMDKLQERAGIVTQKSTSTSAMPAKASAVARAKMEEIIRPASPDSTTAARGGLTSLLGGWWGRK